jgi:hypothetical protein
MSFVLTSAFSRVRRPLIVVAALAVLAPLALVASAQAERPGWFSAPEIVQGQPVVGSTLAGSDGALRCDPKCEPAGPEPSRPGRYFQWLVCDQPHGGGKAAPAGGLPDEGGPCGGAVIVKPRTNILTDPRANFFTVGPELVGRHIQMEVIAASYDCGEVVREGPDAGKQECRYVESHAWSRTIGPVTGTAAAPTPTAPVAPPAVAPTYTALPAITGEAADMETLTVSNGTWNGTAPLEYTYQWLRCSKKNQGCKPIEGATSATYTLTGDDVAAKVTAVVTVKNAAGQFVATAPLTKKIAPATPRPGRDSLEVSQLLPRHRMKVQSVEFGPATLRPGRRWTAKVVVVDRRGFFVEGAQVEIADELGDVTSAPVLTNGRGVATLRLRTTRFVPLGRLVLTVTATRPAAEDAPEDALATVPPATKRVVVRVSR